MEDQTMKQTFRKSVGMMLAVPFWVQVKILSLFVGRDRAVELSGPGVTLEGKVLGKLFIIPTIKDPGDFDVFVTKMKARMKLMKPLYDISVEHEDNEKIAFRYANCPMCEAVIALGLPELAPYFCQSDWEIARDFRDMWDFEREHQIGTGDSFCDHTYERKQ